MRIAMATEYAYPVLGGIPEHVHNLSKELAARYTVANQSREFVEIYEEVAAGRPVAVTDGIEPDPGRPFFPNRRVTAVYQPPSPPAE